jgi:hypothetical protein
MHYLQQKSGFSTNQNVSSWEKNEEVVSGSSQRRLAVNNELHSFQ